MGGYVMAALFLLYGLNETDSVEAPVEGEEDNVVTESIEDFKPLLGFIVLTMFVLYGFVYPIYTRLGCNCCGLKRCVPSKEEQEITDHVIDEPAELVVSESLVNAIIDRVDTMNMSRARKRHIRKRFGSKGGSRAGSSPSEE